MRKYIVLGAVNAFMLAVFAVLSLLSAGIAGSLEDQRTAERWMSGSFDQPAQSDGTAKSVSAVTKDTPYAQVSLFTDGFSSFDINAVYTARVNAEKKLVENSLTSPKKGARIWTDAFSSSSRKMTLKSERGSSEAEVIITGGDFFLFHPQELISGYYYSDNDLMHDRILIDNVAAWQLFGSSDVAGMPVRINDKYFIIAGVFKPREDGYTEKVSGNAPRVFMQFMGLEDIGETAFFSCYEACLPSPVMGMGTQIITGAFSMDDKTAGITAVENSSRYKLKHRFELVSGMGMRSVVDKAIVYPYWENAARMTEDKSAVLLIMQLVSLAVPFCTVIFLFAVLYRKRKELFKKATDASKRILHKLSDKIRYGKKENIGELLRKKTASENNNERTVTK